MSWSIRYLTFGLAFRFLLSYNFKFFSTVWIPNNAKNDLKVARLQLMQALDENNFASAAQLVDNLLKVPRITKRNDGPTLVGTWQVATTIPGPKGPPIWVKYSKSIAQVTAPILGSKISANRNFQIFDETKQGITEFINLSEYVGTSVFATAGGRCSQILENDEQCQDSFSLFDAQVADISFYLRSPTESPLVLNINGSGSFKVLYTDDELRIVENEDKARAVQRKVPLPTEYQDIVSRKFDIK